MITSAGIVLAATFSVFAGLPLVTMAQMGVLVGVGVLLDTFLIRTVMVPALALDLGRWTWWPGALFRHETRRAAGGRGHGGRAAGGGSRTGLRTPVRTARLPYDEWVPGSPGTHCRTRASGRPTRKGRELSVVSACG